MEEHILFLFFPVNCSFYSFLYHFNCQDSKTKYSVIAKQTQFFEADDVWTVHFSHL